MLESRFHDDKTPSPFTMKQVVIAGASGVVGRRVVQELLDRDGPAVFVLARRPLRMEHARLVTALVGFDAPDALAGAMPVEADAAVCCLGTTMKRAGSQASFRAVDHDAVIAFAEAARARGVPRFVLVSSIGADPRSRNFYLRTKGEAEEAVRRIGFAQFTVVRPSLIDDEGTREESRFGERTLLPVARLVFALIGRRRRHAPVRATVLGRAVARLTLDPHAQPVRIVESEDLHRLGA